MVPVNAFVLLLAKKWNVRAASPLPLCRWIPSGLRWLKLISKLLLHSLPLMKIKHNKWNCLIFNSFLAFSNVWCAVMEAAGWVLSFITLKAVQLSFIARFLFRWHWICIIREIFAWCKVLTVTECHALTSMFSLKYVSLCHYMCHMSGYLKIDKWVCGADRCVLWNNLFLDMSNFVQLLK